MFNILSLTALRNKVTGPGKVVKNLMKGLDIIGYPYVLNKDLNATKRLWIHDDTFALKKLDMIHPDTKVLLGPNLYPLPRKIPTDIHLEPFPHLMPSSWVVDFWKHFGYTGILDSWPAGIDTELFRPSSDTKTKVLIYFKQRKEEDLATVTRLLDTRNIKYETIYYGRYKESDFQEALRSAKYVIWIGCSESQGIALGEVLACNIPILLWDIERFDQRGSSLGSFTPEEFHYTPVTSAPYFDETCGLRIREEKSLSEALDQMESRYTSFTPRLYIENNLSLALQAKRFIELYDTHYGLSYEAGLGEKLLSNRSFHNNFLITKLFDIYDSSLVASLRKFLK